MTARIFVAVQGYMKRHMSDQIYLATAKVRGIHTNNTCSVEFIKDNMIIQSNVIPAAFIIGVHKLFFFGSSYVYPHLAKQPISEDCLLMGRLEPTNDPYATEKIASIKMCKYYNRLCGVYYRSAIPTNLYGENDNFHPKNSHVISALKFNAQNIK